MEHISSGQLKKYQHILNQIDSEFKQNELLKKEVENETNKLLAVRVAMQESFAKENVFRVIVKIFSSIFEIFYLYSDEIPQEEFESLRALSECKFYVVEVYISKSFWQKITNQNWLLNACIKSGKKCVLKSVRVKKGLCKGRLLIVVPFDTTTDATVTTTLLMHFGNFFTALKISSVTVDISYHFSLYKKSQISPLIKIAQIYSLNLNQNLLLTTPILDYNFSCKCNSKHFFESVVKNCYHRLNPETFASFTNETSNIITVQFSIGVEDNAVIKLNRSENILNIICNPYDLCSVKKYFIDEIRCQRVCIEKMWLLGFMNYKQHLRGELVEAYVKWDNLKIIYEELRKLMFELAV